MADEKHEHLQVYRATKQRVPETLFIIERSKNKNIVVYAAIFQGDSLHPERPIDVFWHDIDPAYVAENRKKGKLDDRTELNMLESQFAYGVQAKSTGKPHEFRLHLVALPDRECFLIRSQEGVAHVRLHIKGKPCHLARVYVHSVERWMNPMPKVEYVELFGHHAETGEIVHEKIIPK